MRYLAQIGAAFFILGNLIFTRWADFGSTDQALTSTQQAWTISYFVWQHTLVVLLWLCISYHTKGKDRIVSWWLMWYSVLIAIWRGVYTFTGVPFNSGFAVLLAFTLLIVLMIYFSLRANTD